ncbi:hypothetical protein IKQ_05955 [Bacillus cereus VDM053]|nr:hypothetical protein IKQ_05955 [Bacillus cereus VDM053]
MVAKYKENIIQLTLEAKRLMKEYYEEVVEEVRVMICF